MAVAVSPEISSKAAKVNRDTNSMVKNSIATRRKAYFTETPTFSLQKEKGERHMKAILHGHSPFTPGFPGVTGSLAPRR